MKTFGTYLRTKRNENGISLRECARRVGIQPSYLSDIEHDRRIPADDVLIAIGRVLAVPQNDVFARAGKLGETAEVYLRTRPELIQFVRWLESCAFSDDELRSMFDAVVDRETARLEDSDDNAN